MSEYVNPKSSREFIARTEEIIEQYLKLESSLHEKYYDVTLLTNCFTSIIIHLRDEKINKINDEDLTELLRSTIESSKNKATQRPITIKFREYVIALRNGLAHGKISFENNDERISNLIVNGTSNHEEHEIKFNFDLTEEHNKLREITSFLLQKFYH